MNKEQYLPQTFVKDFADRHNLTYIHVLYEGPFISWNHCRTFCNSPAYGDMQEGIVVKNQTRLTDKNTRTPFVLKIVNECFSEVKENNHRQKIEDPQKLAEKQTAQSLMETIVTKRRVEKEIFKMRDEGIIPEQVSSKDMATIAKILPKRIFDDCVKEEAEIVQQAGAYAGKTCSRLAMKYASEIVLGTE